MATLPQGLSLDMMQNAWARFLNPWLKNPMSSGVYIKDITLNSGVNVINHKLGRVPQGWIAIDVQGASTVYRSAPFNDLTLTLTLTAGPSEIMSLYVF